MRGTVNNMYPMTNAETVFGWQRPKLNFLETQGYDVKLQLQ